MLFAATNRKRQLAASVANPKRACVTNTLATKGQALSIQIAGPDGSMGTLQICSFVEVDGLPSILS